MAGDTLSTVVLLGLGLDTFSMSSIDLSSVKEIIRSVNLNEAEELARKVMGMSSSLEIDKYVRAWMNERFEKI